MIGIRVASLLHTLWGLYLLFFWYRLPQPYGSFEPYLLFIPPFNLGIIFLTIGACAALKNIFDYPWWAKPVLVIPQQVVLFWGVVGAFYLIIIGSKETDRLMLSLCYGIAITTFHTYDLFRLWHECMIRREIENGTAGNTGTP